MTDRRFAKDVARELDRRRRTRRLVFLLLWAVLIALAVAYVRCGGSWGLGGKGAGSGGGGHGVGLAADALDRCEIRVTGDGIYVDGVVRKRDDVVTICSKRHGADVVITGDAREGDWKELEAALKAAKIEIYVHTK